VAPAATLVISENGELRHDHAPGEGGSPTTIYLLSQCLYSAVLTPQLREASCDSVARPWTIYRERRSYCASPVN